MKSIISVGNYTFYTLSFLLSFFFNTYSNQSMPMFQAKTVADQTVGPRVRRGIELEFLTFRITKLRIFMHLLKTQART